MNVFDAIEIGELIDKKRAAVVAALFATGYFFPKFGAWVWAQYLQWNQKRVEQIMKPALESLTKAKPYHLPAQQGQDGAGRVVWPR